MKTYNTLTPKLALQLAAPHTWAASACPVLFAELYCSVSSLPLNLVQILSLIAASILLQSAVNTLNDYMDFKKGADSKEDNVEVSDAVLVYAGINPRSALLLGLGYLLAGVVLGILSSMYAGFTPIMIGIVGVLVVLVYSGGPLPVSYLPIGEIVSGVVMGGLIPLGTAACADNRLHPGILFWSLPLIIGIGLIMMSNNGCDIEKDIAAGRRTLPVFLGRENTRKLYRGLLYLWLILLCLLPVLLLGGIGLVTPLLLAAGARKPFVWLLRSSLEPAGRIRQMKTIAAANILGGGAYIAALLAQLIISLTMEA